MPDNISIPLFASVLMGTSIALFLVPLTTFWDKVADAYIASVKVSLQKLGVETDLTWPLRIWGLGIAATFVFCAVVLGIPLIGTVAAAAVFVFPRRFLHHQARQRQTLLRDQLVSAIEQIANSIRARANTQDAITDAVRHIPMPLQKEFAMIAMELNRGVYYTDALENAKTRIQTNGFGIFVSAISACESNGGDLPPVLDKIRKSLKDNQTLERKLEADTANGRTVMNYLAFFPFLFVLVIYFFNPVGTALLFTTTQGEVIVCIVLLLVYGGYHLGTKWLEIDLS